MAARNAAAIRRSGLPKSVGWMEVHPNTVRYRLQQIAAKTGHDPRTFSGLVDLLCILEMAGEDQQS